LPTIPLSIQRAPSIGASLLAWRSRNQTVSDAEPTRALCQSLVGSDLRADRSPKAPKPPIAKRGHLGDLPLPALRGVWIDFKFLAQVTEPQVVVDTD